MKKIMRVLGLSCLFTLCLAAPTFAEGCDESSSGFSISPVTKVLTLEGGNTYDDTFLVKNVSSAPASFRVYASPYSVTDENYNVNFSNETNYTQITRWIEFKDASGNYVTEATFTVDSCTELEISYHVATPESIPNGGQYAVIFAEGVNDSTSGGIKAISRVGLVIYGRATGETINSAEVRDLTISKVVDGSIDMSSHSGEIKGGDTMINTSAVVQNTGNVDITARSVLTVKNIFGAELFSHKDSISVLPETSRKITDIWEETPFFGLFSVTYTVTAIDQTVSVSRLVLVMPLAIILLVLVLVAIIVIWIIIRIKKHRARKARYIA